MKLSQVGDNLILLLLATSAVLVPTLVTVTETVNRPIELVYSEEEINVEEVNIPELLKSTYESNSQYNIAGVIYIEDVMLDVVMNSTNNNEDYLHGSRTNEYSREGELFFSRESKVNDDNKDIDMTRIYGHNMASGRKFGRTHHLLNGKNNRPMYYYDGEIIRVFELKSGFSFIDGTESFERNLMGSDKVEFLNRITSRGIVNHGEITDAPTVFLQTCETAVGDRRYVYMYQESGVLK